MESKEDEQKLHTWKDLWGNLIRTKAPALSREEAARHFAILQHGLNKQALVFFILSDHMLLDEDDSSGA